MVEIQFTELNQPKKSLNLRERFEQILAPYYLEMISPNFERRLRNDIQMFFDEFYGDFEFEIIVGDIFVINPKRERDHLIIKDFLNIRFE